MWLVASGEVLAIEPTSGAVVARLPGPDESAASIFVVDDQVIVSSAPTFFDAFSTTSYRVS